jgi:hypothetical protein
MTGRAATLSLRWRLALLILFATGVPALTGVLVTRQAVRDVLDVALSPQLDAALEAGVHQARENYQARRADLDAVAANLAELWSSGDDDPTARGELLGEALVAWLDATDRAVLTGPDGTDAVLQSGSVAARTGRVTSTGRPGR